MRHNHFVMGIPWLHVIRSHPHFLRAYEEILAPRPAFRRWPRLLLRLTTYLARWLASLIRSVRTQGFGIRGSLDGLNAVDVLIVSHLANASHLKGATDFYFDSLPRELSKQGHSLVIALIDHTGNQYPAEWLASSQGDTPYRLALGHSMSILQEMLWASGCLKASWQLMKYAKSPCGRALPRGIVSRAIVETWSGGSRATHRIASQVRDLTARLRPQLVLTTFEGHAWEACTFAQVRQSSPGTKCLGYQHAPLFRYQHAIMRRLGGDFDPDGVLCSGIAAAKRFHEMRGDRRIHVGVLGSPRAGSVATSIHVDEGAGKMPLCLVLFDGLLDESLLLWRFLEDAADRLPEMKFRCRLHPAMPLEAIKRHLSGARTLATNIHVSSGSLDDDARDARWVVYRGTSAVISAVSFGAVPVYLAQAGELTNDPLYELGSERPIVMTAQDFADVVRLQGGSPPAKDQVERVAQHCRDIYSPMRVQAIDEFFVFTVPQAHE
jgi:hypothetical protein